MELVKVMENLKRKGYSVVEFPNAQLAAEYLNQQIDHVRVGFGGSQTLTEMDLRYSLATHNDVVVPDFHPEGVAWKDMAAASVDTDVYLLSANAVSEAGDIINIDGSLNRLIATLTPPKKVYYVIGINKIGGNLAEAIYRARNTAAPKNALRLHCKTPCAMAVIKRLESIYKDRHNGADPDDQLEWQRFIESLSEEELSTHCYDCKSPDRICGSMLVHFKKPTDLEAEIILVDEPVGF